MRQRAFVLAAALVAIAAGSFSPALADTFIVKEITQTAGDGTSATERHEIWFGGDRLAMTTPAVTQIVRADLKRMFIVQHDNKVVLEMTLPFDVKAVLPPAVASMMLEQMKLEATITPTEERRKIGAWNARRFDVEVKSPSMTMTSVVWATTDVGTEVDMSALRDLVGEIATAMQPSMKSALDEMKKVEGLEVLKETTSIVLGSTVKSVEKLVSLEQKPAPPGLYDPPPTYERRAFSMEGLMSLDR